jgi:hypothetical protein
VYISFVREQLFQGSLEILLIPFHQHSLCDEPNLLGFLAMLLPHFVLLHILHVTVLNLLLFQIIFYPLLFLVSIVHVKRETYPLQNQTAAVAPEALAIFSDRPVTMWTYAGQRRVKEHNQGVTPEAMSNYHSITIHLPSSKDTIPSLSSVSADIIK